MATGCDALSAECDADGSNQYIILRCKMRRALFRELSGSGFASARVSRLPGYGR